MSFLGCVTLRNTLSKCQLFSGFWGVEVEQPTAFTGLLPEKYLRTYPLRSCHVSHSVFPTYAEPEGLPPQILA